MENIRFNQLSNISECVWSSSLQFKTIILSIMFVLFFILIIYTILHTTDKVSIITHSGIIALLLFIVLHTIQRSPRNVSVNSNGIKINCIGTTVEILQEDIINIEQFSDRSGLKKWMGSNAFFGNTGTWKCKALGKFTAYVTDWSKAYVIYRKNQKPVVVSVEDPTIFAAFMKKD